MQIWISKYAFVFSTEVQICFWCWLSHGTGIQFVTCMLIFVWYIFHVFHHVNKAFGPTPKLHRDYCNIYISMNWLPISNSKFHFYIFSFGSHESHSKHYSVETWNYYGIINIYGGSIFKDFVCTPHPYIYIFNNL